MLSGSDHDNSLTERILGCAIEVHRELGPGLLEPIYETALCYELRASKLTFRRQMAVPLYYKGELLGDYRPDLVVDNRIVVEIKAIAHLEPVHVQQVATYLRVLGLHVGLLLNFNTAVLKHGVRRVVK